jgi:hypothetical protein
MSLHNIGMLDITTDADREGTSESLSGELEHAVQPCFFNAARQICSSEPIISEYY